MTKYAAVVGEYEDRIDLGVFKTRQEAYAAIGQFAVDQAATPRGGNKIDRAYIEEIEEPES